MMERGKKPTQFEEFDRKTQELIQAVGEAMQLPDYKKIFSNYENKYVLPKFVCYYVLYERGFSYPHIGSKFKRNHATIMYAIKKAKQMPECMVYTHKINEIIRREKEYEELAMKYKDGQARSCLFEEIKNLLNKDYSDADIIKTLDIPPQTGFEISHIIRTRCKTKKVPDYKNCVIKEIYI